MEDCLFCKIVEGSVPSEKVYEDEHIYAFKDIHPVAPVHVLIIPKKHMQDIMALDDPTISHALMQAVQKIATQLGVDSKGFRVINNCGKDGGQVVPHLHLHLLAGKHMGNKL